jgi:hypothetical protein
VFQIEYDPRDILNEDIFLLTYTIPASITFIAGPLPCPRGGHFTLMDSTTLKQNFEKPRNEQKIFHSKDIFLYINSGRKASRF